MGSNPQLLLARAAVVRVGDLPYTEMPDLAFGMDDARVETGRPVLVDGNYVGKMIVALSPVDDTFNILEDPIRIPGGRSAGSGGGDRNPRATSRSRVPHKPLAVLADAVRRVCVVGRDMR